MTYQYHKKKKKKKKNLKFYQLCKYLSLIEFRNIVEEVLILRIWYIRIGMKIPQKRDESKL